MAKFNPNKLPKQVEMSGGKSPRQRIWEAIRRFQRDQEFTPMMIEGLAKTTHIITDNYFDLLERAGFITPCSQKSPERAVRRFGEYRLVNDNGIEAPRFDQKGNLVSEASATERMWNTIRRLFKTGSFTVIELAALASTSTSKVSLKTAKNYVEALLVAGYLAKTPSNQHKLTLLPHMNSGSRAPICQKTKVVYDPNLDKIVWAAQLGEQDE